MKLNQIKDFEKFFSVVDKCKGKVEVVSNEGDRIVLNSQLCRFVLVALAESDNAIINNLELHCEEPEDVSLFLQYMMEGC